MNVAFDALNLSFTYLKWTSKLHDQLWRPLYCHTSHLPENLVEYLGVQDTYYLSNCTLHLAIIGIALLKELISGC